MSRPMLPIWREGWIAERLSTELHGFLTGYVFSPDEGGDHEPTESERIIMEDMLNGALSSEPVTAILQDAARALAFCAASCLTVHVEIAHDGFAGDIIGHYVTREGKRGVVVQQDGTRVVHV